MPHGLGGLSFGQERVPFSGGGAFWSFDFPGVLRLRSACHLGPGTQDPDGSVSNLEPFLYKHKEVVLGRFLRFFSFFGVAAYGDLPTRSLRSGHYTASGRTLRRRASRFGRDSDAASSRR